MRVNMVNKRKTLGLTQKDVATKINRSRSTYASYELGTITPSLDIGIKIKQVLKTNDDKIFLNTSNTYDDNNAQPNNYFMEECKVCEK